MNGNNKIALGAMLWIQATFLGSTFGTWIPTLGLTFAASDQLYLGGEDGSLQLLNHNAENNWSLQQVWQGSAGIRLLKA